MSLDPNLTAGAGEFPFNGQSVFAADVFLRDVNAGTTTLLSPTGGPIGPRDTATEPTLSGDGARAAFTMEPFSTDDTEIQNSQVLLRTVSPTTLFRVDATASQVANGRSTQPAISLDGLTVAFASDATNLAPPDSQGSDIFARQIT